MPVCFSHCPIYFLSLSFVPSAWFTQWFISIVWCCRSCVPGSSGLVLSLSSYDQVTIQELKLRSPSPGTTTTTTSAGSSRVQSPSSSPSAGTCRPLSPVASEAFPWPDVRELRTKYAPGRTGGTTGVSRSHSTPDKMTMMMMLGEGEEERLRVPLSRSSSKSSSSFSLDARGSLPDVSSAAAACASYAQTGKDTAGEKQQKRVGRGSKLFRVNSLDDVMGTLHLNEQQQQSLAETPKDACECVEEDKFTQEHRVAAAETAIMASAGHEGEKGTETKAEQSRREEKVLNGDSEDSRSALELEAWRSLRRRDWRTYERLQSAHKYSSGSLKKLEASHHSLVKNLREKFQSLSSYT